MSALSSLIFSHCSRGTDYFSSHLFFRRERESFQSQYNMMNFLEHSVVFFSMLRGLTKPYTIYMLGSNVSQADNQPQFLKWEEDVSFIYHVIKLPVQETTRRSVNHRPLTHQKDASELTSVEGQASNKLLLPQGTWSS